MTAAEPAGPAATGSATPYLLLDRGRLEANVARAARTAAAAGVDLRPHVKTHKSARIARIQLDAGAIGITVATVGEAEVFAAHECRDVFVAYPLWLDRSRAARVTALVDDGVRISLGVDSADGAAQAAASLGAHRVRIPVRVEVDCGQHLAGAAPDAAGDVARAAADAGMPVEGVFTFPGHSYGPGAGTPAALDEAAALDRAAACMEEAGVPAPVRSGGSTPSLSTSLSTSRADGARGGGLTELRPGVYALGDAQQWELGAMDPDDMALCCVATVVSRGAGRVVLDAGSKVLGADRPAWATGFGRLPDHPGARVVQLSEHHAVVETGGDVAAWPLGCRVRVLPNHVCTAVNLADALEVDETGGEAPWPVDARGRNI